MVTTIYNIVTYNTFQILNKILYGFLAYNFFFVFIIFLGLLNHEMICISFFCCDNIVADLSVN